MIELLIVLIVIAILASVAVAMYHNYQERAHDAAAQERLYNLVPSMQGHFVDNNGYSGMTTAGLKASYDAAIDTSVYSFGTLTQTTYCVQTTAGGRTWRKNGPDARLEPQACP